MNVSKQTKRPRKTSPQKSNKRKAESDNESQADVEWDNIDKRTLLEALKKYGSKNIPAISKMLQHIPPEAIESKIAEYSAIAERLYEHELLNKWLNCNLYEPGDSVIPEALLFIQLLEDHPPPCEAEGYDFRAIYNFLYRSCLEQTSYFDLSEQDRTLLCSMLTQLEKKVWPKFQKDIWDYIGRVYSRRNIKKVYPGKNVHSL
ncbi:uncharacterized protein LOC143181733 [Calliopsis andreniformis]|uniref:uncharacterized protein LOC143181733 n=1 Tax=Calliopsis andreniformis TaxID=337506 RepID=UPI003FCED3C4